MANYLRITLAVMIVVISASAFPTDMSNTGENLSIIDVLTNNSDPAETVQVSNEELVRAKRHGININILDFVTNCKYLIYLGYGGYGGSYPYGGYGGGGN